MMMEGFAQDIIRQADPDRDEGVDWYVSCASGHELVGKADFMRDTDGGESDR